MVDWSKTTKIFMIKYEQIQQLVKFKLDFEHIEDDKVFKEKKTFYNTNT